MSKVKSRFAVLVVSLMALGVVAAPAAQAANLTIPLNNYSVNGQLGIKKLNQSLTLPQGTFNGSISIDQTTGHGTIVGTTVVPPFTAHLSVLGLPATISAALSQPANGTTGTIDPDPSSPGDVIANISLPATLQLKSMGLLGLTIPLGNKCKTTSPVVLPLHFQGPLDVTQPINFAGTYTLPPVSGCGILGPVLNLLMAGPNNPFTGSLAPPSV